MGGKYFSVVALVMLLASMVVQAQPELSYNYLDARYRMQDETLDDGREIDAEGYSVEGSALLSERLFAVASFGEILTDPIPNGGGSVEIELESLTLGLGLRQRLAERLDLNLGVAYRRSRVEAAQGAMRESDSDSGHVLIAGLRALPQPWLEIEASVGRSEIFDDTSTTFALGALVEIVPRFQLGATYLRSSDVDGISLGGRIGF
ncbi:hypothetical protein [Algiphilus aromaticivorans]|uniref:hypothetical protein n=1 Tax=Algiphilus aromaticivorans TaxID=382454 RepID=UPI0005C16CB4|nr:hypothetical protein [Algiphilus aromaticivorans]